MSREDPLKFEYDVFYEAWTRGLNPDRATECASDCYYAGRTASECVDGYERQVERQREAHRIEREQQEIIEAQEYEAAYWAEMGRQEQAAMEAAEMGAEKAQSGRSEPQSGDKP